MSTCSTVLEENAGWPRVLDTDDECKPLQTLFWKDNHGEYRKPVENLTWSNKLKEKAQPLGTSH
jgi:hypothetical protein